MALKTKTLKTALLSAAAALLAGWTAASAQTLVLYTSQPDKDAAETSAAFSRRNPGVKVEIFRSGTTEIMNKLMAEIAAGDPKPDVLLVADSISLELLKKENRLLAHPEADVANLPAEAYDRDRTYFGTKLITSGIVYNTGAKERPTSWKDLADAIGHAQPAAEVEALAPGDVVLLGPLTAPFDALRIGSKLHPVRRVEDGGFILDIAP